MMIFLQDESSNVIQLFCGIMVHKSIVMYTAGSKILESFNKKMIKPVVFIILLSVVTPLGAIFGFVLEVRA